MNPKHSTLLNLLQKRLLLHCFFWSVFAFFFALGFLSSEQSWTFICLNYFGILATYLCYVYVNLYLIYDFLIRRKKSYFVALVVFVGLLYACTSLNALFFNITNSQGRHISFFNFVPFFAFLAAMTLSLKLARGLYLALAQEITLKNALLLQKEHFLRSQIHPHFLFNTLSNFYGLALEQSPQLPHFMMRLANILRHQIDNAQQQYVSLRQEVDYLKDYVELEKIRFGNNLHFQFVSPMTLPLIC